MGAKIEHSAAAIGAQVQRILSSPGFTRNPALSRFLRFTIELTIQGKEDEIKESVLGTAVFNRASSFDPRADTIVRTQAHRLRSLLATYYEKEGRADPILIEYPKGAYVPNFRAHDQPAVELRPIPRSVLSNREPGVDASSADSYWRIAFAIGMVAVGLFAGWWLFSRPKGDSSSSPAAMLSLQLPVQGALDFDRGTAVLSPKGQYAVFPVIESTGARRLWMRPLRSAVARPLEGSNGGALPFWSQDETAIGFFGGGYLKIYRLSDGSVRNLCEAPLGRGGTWAKDGTILFARQTGGPIYRIQATGGGAPVPVTSINKSLEESCHRWPEWLPDGRHFLYTTHSYRRGNDGVYEASLDGGAPVRLIPYASQAHYAAAGGNQFLLYLGGGAVKVRSFDPLHSKIGKEHTLVDGIRYSANAGSAFSVAAPNYLAFHSFEAETTEIVRYDRAGNILRLIDRQAAYSAVTVSPTGSKLALEISDHPSPDTDIWIADTVRPEPLRITSGSANYAAWSADGRSIYYLDFSQGRPTLYHKALNQDGKGTVVWKPSGVILPTDCSPDGRFLAYHEENPRTFMDLYLLPVDPETGQSSGEPIVVRRTPFNESHGFFSPDGRYLAYVSDETGRPEVYAQEVPTKPPRDVRRWKISSEGGAHPRWAHNGRELYFLSPEKSLMAVAISPSSDGPIFEKPVKLFETRATSAADSRSPYGVSPDGKSFYFSVIHTDSTAPTVNVLTSWVTVIGDR